MSDIVVFGSFVVDLMARSAHIPVPGETIKSSLFRMGAGGKGSNQAVACKLSGGDVSVVTKVGRDAFAQEMCIRDRPSPLESFPGEGFFFSA